VYFQWGLKNVCEKGEGVVGNQAKSSQSSNWRRRLARSASRRPPVC